MPALSITGQEIGSQACASCHSSIYRSYQTTGMARSSGLLLEGKLALPPGPISDTRGGPVYQVSAGYRMQFANAATGTKGERALRWFIGSGTVGHSFLFADEGFLFQAPVSYYSAVARWDLSPGYAAQSTIELSKAIEPACLHCHATRIRPVAGTINRYAETPFAEGGIGCEKCHGPGGQHVANVNAGKEQLAIVNPAKLNPAQRNSICEQCHLTGAARVVRAGHSITSFQPGDLFSDHVAVFVWDGRATERAATDHAEQLSRSRCQMAAGTRLWCGSCHDPHSQPAQGQRVAFFRKPCVSCHGEEQCQETRQKRLAAQDDCAACHMPKSSSREGEHVVYTDHQIRKRPQEDRNSAPRKLRSFWTGAPSARDQAMAYASFALTDATLRPRALQLLQAVEPQAKDDAPLLAQLAQFYDAMGKATQATALYERVLRLDPSSASGANLAIYRMKEGRRAEAIELWRSTFSRHPELPAAGLNLALVLLEAGERSDAESVLVRVLRFHPDLQTARDLLARVRHR